MGRVMSVKTKKQKSYIYYCIKKCKSNYELRKELQKIDDNFKQYRTKNQQLEIDKDKYLLLKACVMIAQVTNIIFMLRDTFSNNYREKGMLIAYWCFWFVMMLLFLFAHYKEKPHMMRVLNLMMIARNILPFYNYEDRKSFDDPVKVINFSLF